MSINTLIILGSNGMLGNYIKRYFQTKTNINVITINRPTFDAYNHDITKLEQIIQVNLTPQTLIFNAIGTIPQANNDYEIINDHYKKINQEFPHHLANLCEKYNAKLIHPSTDCVFNGGRGNYTENDIPDETNIYGVSKYLGEPSNCTVMRTSIMGEEVNNKRSFVEFVKQNEGKTINGYNNHYWNGITCLQYAKNVEYMINNNYFWNGVRHICSPNSVTKYELCQIVNDVYDLNINIQKYTTPEKINKCLCTIYDCPFNIPHLRDQIIEMKQFTNTLYV
jgi:dTDP-4-dehydrorhamnose reductase